jgi:transposase-like protein
MRRGRCNKLTAEQRLRLLAVVKQNETTKTAICERFDISFGQLRKIVMADKKQPGYTPLDERFVD